MKLRWAMSLLLSGICFGGAVSIAGAIGELGIRGWRYHGDPLPALLALYDWLRHGFLWGGGLAILAVVLWRPGALLFRRARASRAGIAGAAIGAAICAALAQLAAIDVLPAAVEPGPAAGVAVAVAALAAVLALGVRAAQGQGGRRGLAVGAAAVAGLFLIAAGARGWTAFAVERPNVLVVVVDCLRADRLSSYGHDRPTSPVVDGLARRGVRFAQAYSTGSWTKPGVASILTGLPPAEHRAYRPSHMLRHRLRTLPEALSAAGYYTLGVVGGNSWIGHEFGFQQGFDLLTLSPSGAKEVSDRVLQVLFGVGRSPWFAYVHYMDVHVPYTEHEGADRYAAGMPGSGHLRAGEVDHGWVRRLLAADAFGADNLARLGALYDGQVRHIDGQVGRLLEGLEALGELDNTLIVFTADHGEELADHGNFEHGHTLWDEVVHVPMIVSGTGVAPATVSEPVSLIDIAPTILAAAGLADAAAGLPGVSLLDVATAPAAGFQRPLPAVSTLYMRDKFSVRMGRERWILRDPVLHAEAWPLVGPRETARRAYVGMGDPVPGSPALAAAEALRKEVSLADAAATERAIGSDLRRELKALGYLQ